jgi:predicted transcriptional regulator of viral defense system
MREQIASRRFAVSQFAAEQHGVAALAELIGLGLSTSAVSRWAADGGLHRIHRGVYAVGRRELSVHGRWLAAVKACGPFAVLSHQTAAALWDLLRSLSAAIHVSTPRRVRPPGVTVHRVADLGAADWEIRDGIPVTTVARTLADCAETMPTRRVVRLLEQAERLGIFDLAALSKRPRWLSGCGGCA